MKQPYCFLSLLIPGLKAPGNDIDVYLEPLVDELQELWYNGVDAYDASRKENFCMRAALLWTINNFPAYAYLSGWSTNGALACPSCNKETPSTRLKYGRKFSYIDARRFLSPNHKWRGNTRDFNGEVERRPAPKILYGDDILNQLDSLEDIKFDMEGKTKDNLNARRDLKEMGIRKDLHPTQRDGKWCYPAACYSLSSDEKSKVCKFLKTIKVPDGYSSNLSRCIRFLRKLKCYVRNRSRPEGSIAEGYIVEESLIFCSRYLHGSEKGYNRVDKNDEDDHVKSNCGLSIFEQKGCPLLRDTSRNLEYEQSNSNMNFDDSFFHRIMQMRKEGNSHVSCGLYSLARGPFDGIQRFMGRTSILRSKQIVLFKCDWWDIDHIGKGVKIDKHDFVSVNTNRKLATNESFVLASQAEQVFYVKDNLHPNWSIVLNGHSAYFTDGTVNEETFQQDAQDFSCTFEEDEDFMYWWRNNLDVISTDFTLADDIIEEIESEPETDDEDLLL
ncbi:uncharacterized protein [Nicotiana tomentosiformis]|uniref:uncharacterized protein n=1 Tax=Nicotiana tomentosiformis TaxID=4098 RepID=UPI00388C698F